MAEKGSDSLAAALIESARAEARQLASERDRVASQMADLKTRHSEIGHRLTALGRTVASAERLVAGEPKLGRPSSRDSESPKSMWAVVAVLKANPEAQMSTRQIADEITARGLAPHDGDLIKFTSNAIYKAYSRGLISREPRPEGEGNGYLYKHDPTTDLAPGDDAHLAAADPGRS